MSLPSNGPAGDSALSRLLREYQELEGMCYRVAIGMRDARGRFRRHPRSPRASALLLKKIDLDRALLRLCERFFGEGESDPQYEDQGSGREKG